MNYKELKVALSTSIDADRVTECVRHYSDARFHAVLFKNGSWVFPSVVAGEPEDGAVRLKELAQGNISFVVREMDDGNYIVAFNEKVFRVVFRDEYERLREEAVREADGDLTEEIILGKKDADPDHVYIGLIGRTRLLKDIEHPEVIVHLAPH